MSVRKPIIPEFGEHLEKTRKRRGLTQVEFSKKLGVSQQTVSRWERGDIPPLTALSQIARVLDVSLKSLTRFQPRSPVLISDRVAEMEEYVRMLEGQIEAMGRRLAAMEGKLDEMGNLLGRI